MGILCLHKETEVLDELSLKLHFNLPKSSYSVTCEKTSLCNVVSVNIRTKESPHPTLQAYQFKHKACNSSTSLASNNHPRVMQTFQSHHCFQKRNELRLQLRLTMCKSMDSSHEMFSTSCSMVSDVFSFGLMSAIHCLSQTIRQGPCKLQERNLFCY